MIDCVEEIVESFQAVDVVQVWPVVKMKFLCLMYYMCQISVDRDVSASSYHSLILSCARCTPKNSSIIINNMSTSLDFNMNEKISNQKSWMIHNLHWIIIWFKPMQFYGDTHSKGSTGKYFKQQYTKYFIESVTIINKPIFLITFESSYESFQVKSTFLVHLKFHCSFWVNMLHIY